MSSVPELLDTVENHLAPGYRRIKLKIEPGWDITPVRAVRTHFGDDVLLQVDANAAYSHVDTKLLTRLDEFGPLLLEQPLVNVKPGRVGGYLEARRHPRRLRRLRSSRLVRHAGNGPGRAGNTVLAALPNFTLPGGISASDRYYATGITEPFVLWDGHLAVPTGPGLGVAPLPDALAKVTTEVSEILRE